VQETRVLAETHIEGMTTNQEYHGEDLRSGCKKHKGWGKDVRSQKISSNRY
jgi:hypothetical protein